MDQVDTKILLPYSLEKFVILIFVRKKYSFKCILIEFPVSNFRHLTLIFVTSDRKQYNLPFATKWLCATEVRAVNDDVFSLW